MDKKAIKLDFLSSAGPYSHIVEAGGFHFLSGMLPVDMEKDIRETQDIKKATEICLGNIQKSLKSVGSSMDKVVKISVFLADTSYFNDMNEVYKTFFPSNQPARTCVVVKGIPGDFPIEIEVIAVK